MHRTHLMTPPGAGAIAVLRVSGPNPAGVVDSLFVPATGKSLSETKTGRLRYGVVLDGLEVIDDVVASRLKREGPAELELCCHGGIRVVERVLDALARAGAPLAEPTPPLAPWPTHNEIEREALVLLAASTTTAAVELLAWQWANLGAWLEETAELFAHALHRGEERMRAFVQRGEIVGRWIHGVTVALVGPANSGKSTLFNRLVGREAAIVSPMAGTTRDWVCAPVEIGGLGVTLIDTAGRRERSSGLERTAIRGGTKTAESADLRLVVLDGSSPPPPDVMATLSGRRADRSILVLNKCDVAAYGAAAEAGKSVANLSTARVYISALTGEGVAQLVDAMLEVLVPGREHRRLPAAFTARQLRAGRDVLEVLPRHRRHAARLVKRELIGNRG